jgi:hypothetical protein
MKHLFKITILLSSTIWFSGCTAKKTSTSERTEKETFIQKSYDYVSQPIQTTLFIDDICRDTIARNVFKEVSGSNSASISKDEKGRLRMDLITGLSRVKTDTIYVDRFVEIDNSVEVVRYKTPLWHWFAHIVAILLIFILLKLKWL